MLPLFSSGIIFQKLFSFLPGLPFSIWVPCSGFSCRSRKVCLAGASGLSEIKMGNKTPPPVRRPQASSMTQMSPSPQHSHGHSPALEGPLLRCPACTRTVRAPAGAQRFRCPCGRVLAQPNTALPSPASAPTLSTPGTQPLASNTRSIPPSQPPPQQQQSQPSGPPMRVRCPACQQVLLAPNARKLNAVLLFSSS